jgi:hypothetical protein
MIGGAFFDGVLWGGGISGETGAGGKWLTEVCDSAHLDDGYSLEGYEY